jgi:rhamnosyltransferase
MKEKIYVVLVTYNPEIVKLKKCIYNLKEQVYKIIVVDNTPNSSANFKKHLGDKQIELIILNDNYGIAYAQNIGIKKALEDDADFILTSDQDTIYPNNYVVDLIKCFRAESAILNVASISPVYTDENKKDELQPMVYFKNGMLQKDYTLDKCMPVSHVISSGMLIPADVLKNVGLMGENLFIDWVDTEWCWRAQLKGFSIIQTPNVQIDHCLGNPSKSIIGKSITVHSSFRNYYKIRNAVYLLFYNNSLNYSMKIFTLQQILKMIIIHPLTSNNKIQEIFIVLKGIKDGLLSNMGIKL